MRFARFLLIPCLILAVFAAAGESASQSSRVAERQSEWESYKLPATGFVRFVHPTKRLMCRIPESWKLDAAPKSDVGIGFVGTDQTELKIFVEEVPDGIGIKAYLSSSLQALRDIPGGADAITVRRVRLSNLEGREISFEIPDQAGSLSRRVIWMGVAGPRAFLFLLVTPQADSAQTEPFFKAIVESAIIFDDAVEAVTFDQRRAAVIANRPAAPAPAVTSSFEIRRRQPTTSSTGPERPATDGIPVRIDEVLQAAAEIDGLDPALRSAATERLKQSLEVSPNPGIDLLLDRRPLVRAAAVEAMAATRKPAFVPLLLLALRDADVV